MYARIYDAGHMVNEKRPAESKLLFEKWVRGDAFEPLPQMQDEQAPEEL